MARCDKPHENKYSAKVDLHTHFSHCLPTSSHEEEITMWSNPSIIRRDKLGKLSLSVCLSLSHCLSLTSDCKGLEKLFGYRTAYSLTQITLVSHGPLSAPNWSTAVWMVFCCCCPPVSLHHCISLWLGSLWFASHRTPTSKPGALKQGQWRTET